MFPTLHDALVALRRENELIEVEALVNPELELAEIHRRIIQNDGPAILFKNVKGSSFPVVTNLFGSKRRIDILFGNLHFHLEQLLSILEKPSLRALWACRKRLFPLLFHGKKKCRQHSFHTSCTLNQIPFLKCWPDDGGDFLTFPLVYTQSPTTQKENLGMYRVQRHSAHTCGLHFQIGKGGGFHFSEAEQRDQDLPTTIFLGAPPALILSAIFPLPENVSELLFASLLLGKRLPYALSNKSPLPLFSSCDIAILGRAKAHRRHIEGPFGDHLGYLDPAKPYPLFQCDTILAKKNAVVPATIVGKPLQEDAFIGSFIQTLTRPILSLLMPNLLDLHAYPEAGFHSVAAIRIKERYEKEALQLALRVLGEGQLSLTKILFVVDGPISLSNFPSVLSSLLARIRSEEDIIILPSTSNDTLDMTGPKQNHGSKALFFGLGPERRHLPTTFSAPCPSFIRNATVFCPGCLVLDCIDPQIHPDRITQEKSFAEWPLLILVDDARVTASSQLEFLWSVFTRFEPASDIFATQTKISRNSLHFSLPLLIDARMKSSYSSMLQPSSETVSLVDKRWHEYFPPKKGIS